MTFTNKDLKNMIIPLFFEQLLVMLVGIVDTFIVSFVGESAVSGISLVNSFNTIQNLIQFLFICLQLLHRVGQLSSANILDVKNKKPLIVLQDSY